MKVLFENGPDQPEALRFTDEKVRRAFAGREHLLDGLDRVFSDSDAEWRDNAPTADIIVLGRHVGLPELTRASPLRWVQTIAAGVEDLAGRLPEGVLLTNASGVHAAKGGEFMLAAALMLNYCIPKFAEDKLNKAWRQEFGPTLAARRVTLLGTGSIGTAGARLLRAIGARVVGVNRSGRATEAFDRVIPVTALDGVLPETDILISSLPLTPETKGLVGRCRLGALPAGAGVAVVGRSRVFDYAALRDALKSGALSGAVLDVFDEEPLPPTDPLWTCPSLVITPHCSVDDHASYLHSCLDLLADNLERFRKGEKLLCLVDQKAGY